MARDSCFDEEKRKKKRKKLDYFEKMIKLEVR